MATAQAWRDVEETTNLKRRDIVFTAGSSITIDAPADKVFEVIMAFDKYGEWNTWCPKFEFGQDEKIGVGSTGKMHCRMEAQNRNYEIPEEVSIHFLSTKTLS